MALIDIVYTDFNLHIEGAVSGNAPAVVLAAIGNRGQGRAGYEEFLKALESESVAFAIYNIHYAEDLTHQVIVYNNG